MDAEAEPPWMGSRRGNALRIAPAPMEVQGTVLHPYIFAPANFKLNLFTNFCLLRIAHLAFARIRGSQDNRKAPYVFACCPQRLFGRRFQV